MATSAPRTVQKPLGKLNSKNKTGSSKRNALGSLKTPKNNREELQNVLSTLTRPSLDELFEEARTQPEFVGPTQTFWSELLIRVCEDIISEYADLIVPEKLVLIASDALSELIRFSYGPQRNLIIEKAVDGCLEERCLVPFRVEPSEPIERLWEYYDPLDYDCYVFRIHKEASKDAVSKQLFKFARGLKRQPKVKRMKSLEQVHARLLIAVANERQPARSFDVQLKLSEIPCVRTLYPDYRKAKREPDNSRDYIRRLVKEASELAAQLARSAG